MTTSPFCISQTYTMQDVLMLFREKKVGAFPIVDERKVVVGIISDRDLLNSFIDLLGAGSPGCFVGVLIPPSPRDASRIVSAFAEEGIAIASMLVIQNWQANRHAVFMYLLTHNIPHAKRIINDMNVEPIDPMRWFFYRQTNVEGD